MRRSSFWILRLPTKNIFGVRHRGPAFAGMTGLLIHTSLTLRPLRFRQKPNSTNILKPHYLRTCPPYPPSFRRTPESTNMPTSPSWQTSLKPPSFRQMLDSGVCRNDGPSDMRIPSPKGIYRGTSTNRAAPHKPQSRGIVDSPE